MEEYIRHHVLSQSASGQISETSPIQFDRRHSKIPEEHSMHSRSPFRRVNPFLKSTQTSKLTLPKPESKPPVDFRRLSQNKRPFYGLKQKSLYDQLHSKTRLEPEVIAENQMGREREMKETPFTVEDLINMLQNSSVDAGDHSFRKPLQKTMGSSEETSQSSISSSSQIHHLNPDVFYQTKHRAPSTTSFPIDIKTVEHVDGSYSKEDKPSLPSFMRQNLNLIKDLESESESSDSDHDDQCSTTTLTSEPTWLDKEGVYFVLSLNPNKTISKIKKQFSHLKFTYCTIKQSIESMRSILFEQWSNEVILINCNNNLCRGVFGLLADMKILKHKRVVLYASDPVPFPEYFHRVLEINNFCDFVFDALKWSDIPRNVQAKILEIPVIFQTKKYALKSFLSGFESEECTKLMNLFPERVLYHIARNQGYAVICETSLQELPNAYIARQLIEHYDCKTKHEPTQNLMEAEFVMQLCKNVPSGVICLCAGFASGKTTLLMKVGELLLNNSTSHHDKPKFVQYLKMVSILRVLKDRKITSEKELSCDVVLHIISSLITSNKFVQNYLLMPNVGCELLIDDLDQVSDCYLDLSLHFLSILEESSSAHKNNIRLWLAVSTKVMSKLKHLINNIKCYNVAPLNSHHRVYYLSAVDPIWGQERDVARIANAAGGLKNRKSFKELCSENLTDFEQQFIGTPVYCRLLVQNYFHHEEILFSPEGGIPASKLYESFVSQLLERPSEKYKFQKSELLGYYQKFALKKLLPHHVKKFEKIVCDSCKHIDIFAGHNILYSPVFSHQTVAEYFLASFAFQIATKYSIEKGSVKRASAFLVDILVPQILGCGVLKSNISKFWHHDISETKTQMIPYFFESFLCSISDAEQQTYYSSLNDVFAEMFSTAVFSAKVFQLLAENLYDLPNLSKLVVRNLSKEYEPLKHIMLKSEGCKLLSYVFRNALLQSDVEVELLVRKVNTPIKLIRYIIEQDVIKYCNAEYEMIPAENGKFSKYQKERMRAVENAVYWKFIALILKTKYSLDISSLQTATNYWFTEIQSDITKLEVVAQLQNQTGLEKKVFDNVLENFFIAEFVIRMATYGNAVNSMTDAMQAAVKIMLSGWKTDNYSKITTDIENPFSFLSLLNALLEGQTVENNFIAQMRMEVFGFKEVDTEKITELRNQLTTNHSVMIQNIQMCTNSKIDPTNHNNVEPKNVINVFAIAFKNV